MKFNLVALLSLIFTISFLSTPFMAFACSGNPNCPCHKANNTTPCKEYCTHCKHCAEQNNNKDK